MAADAAERLARHERGPRPHRLHDVPVPVDGLEIDRRARRHLERRRAVLVDRRLAQHHLDVPRREVADRRRTVFASDVRGHEVKRHHAQLLHRAARNVLEPRPGIDILHGERPVRLAPVDRIAHLRRFRTRRKRNRLVAGHHGILRQQHALALPVHEVDAEVLRAVGTERDEVVVLVQRIRILPLVAFLSVLVDANQSLRLHLRRHERHADRLLASKRGIDDRELALLRRVVSRKDGQHLLRTGNAARVEDGRGEVRGVAVELLLVGAVRVHLEERLRVDLAPVVVFPARVGDGAAAGMHLRVVAVHLVEADAAHELAVAVHQEHVARAHVPAVHVLETTRGAEHDVAVRKIDSLVVGHALPERQLADAARRHVHFVEMVVVAAGGLLPREENALPVVRNIRVANHAVGVVEQRRLPDVQPFVQRQHAQARAGLEVELLPRAAGVEDVFVAHGVGVGVVRSAHVEMLGEHDAVQFLAERPEQPRPIVTIRRARDRTKSNDYDKNAFNLFHFGIPLYFVCSFRFTFFQLREGFFQFGQGFGGRRDNDQIRAPGRLDFRSGIGMG